MDPDPFFEGQGKLSRRRIAVLGLGLMGGSLALALRGKCAWLAGADPDSRTLELAQKLGLFEALSSRPEDVVRGADLIVLAAPVGAILKLLEDLPAIHSGQTAVLDIGSTKRQIAQKMESLPERFDPLGGHPMCGKEHGGLIHADPAIFQDAAFAFTPLERTSPELRALAGELAVTIGARPLWLDPDTHDRWVASTSHLPYLAAAALAASTPLEARPLAGPGLRGAIRLAASPWSMMGGVLASNRLYLLESLRRYLESLQELERLLEADDFEALQARLQAGAQNQAYLVGGELQSTPDHKGDDHAGDDRRDRG